MAFCLQNRLLIVRLTKSEPKTYNPRRLCGQSTATSARVATKTTNSFQCLQALKKRVHNDQPFIKGVSFNALLADKAFDADWLLQDLDQRGATAVIPPKANRKIQRNYDAEVYKWRHMVENYFARIKEFRGRATRYDKTDCSYTACWNLVAALIASR